MDETDIEKAILRKVYAWMVAGGVVIGGVGGSGLIRIDKFTGSDAELMKKEIMLEVKRMHTECLQMINQVEATKPPGLTRQRIEAVERSSRRTDPQYKQPTWEWN